MEQYEQWGLSIWHYGCVHIFLLLCIRRRIYPVPCSWLMEYFLLERNPAYSLRHSAAYPCNAVWEDAFEGRDRPTGRGKAKRGIGEHEQEQGERSVNRKATEPEDVGQPQEVSGMPVIEKEAIEENSLSHTKEKQIARGSGWRGIGGRKTVTETKTMIWLAVVKRVEVIPGQWETVKGWKRSQL